MQKFLDITFWETVVVGLFSLVGAFFAPVGSFIGVAFTLVIFDYFTGVQAAKKREEKLTSRGHFRSIQKFVMYSIAIISAELIRKVFFDGLFLLEYLRLTYFVALLIVITEFRSNIENIEAITGAKIWGKLIERFPALGGKLNDKK
jgi:phage-related holin